MSCVLLIGPIKDKASRGMDFDVGQLAKHAKWDKDRHEPKSGAHRGFGDGAKVVKSVKSLNYFALFRRVGILETPEPGFIWRIYPTQRLGKVPF